MKRSSTFIAIFTLAMFMLVANNAFAIGDQEKLCPPLYDKFSQNVGFEGGPPMHWSGRWWHIPEIAKQLDLTDAEIKNLDKLFRENREKLIDRKATVEREQIKLETLLEKDNFDEKAILEEFDKLEKARAELAKEHFIFLLDVRKVLGPERLQQLSLTFKKSMRERFGSHMKERKGR